MFKQNQSAGRRTAVVNDPKFRALVAQGLLVGIVLFCAYSGLKNATSNLAEQRIASGFGFLGQTAGFGIAQTLIPWNEAMTYARAYFVGLLNTLTVSLFAIFFATILGFCVGILRLSPNWTLSRLAKWYVEIVRNLPLLFQILFWYLAVLATMPAPRSAISFLDFVFISQRGIAFPRPEFQEGSWLWAAAMVGGLLLGFALRRWSRIEALGAKRTKLSSLALAIVIFGTFLLLAKFYGSPIAFSIPQKERFNLTGGLTIIPEFAAFVVALTIYGSAFIGEIVRAGIQAVPKGQTEAGRSLGIGKRHLLRFIIVPQALRIIIPLLTSQYLNILKNSSLGVSIGYPELVSVGGTILNQTGQAIEVVAMWMATYLTISLLTSVFMNWYNARIALVER
ncbi:amino acid ABC transporter permease [Neorhizobium alkalisoli]|uniref:amino acid ABC transporter permease n=1 Tax=Neorhizobium alkalisoli TaxID=528178 RepID=UPI000CFA130B|nr:ABC transporter permease subunit [Neorhizobium alkalisoli]